MKGSLKVSFKSSIRIDSLKGFFSGFSKDSFKGYDKAH